MGIGDALLEGREVAHFGAKVAGIAEPELGRARTREGRLLLERVAWRAGRPTPRKAPEQRAVERLLEGQPELGRHELIEQRVDGGAEIVHDSRYVGQFQVDVEQELVLVLVLDEIGGEQALRVEGHPTDEEGDHHGHWVGGGGRERGMVSGCSFARWIACLGRDNERPSGTNGLSCNLLGGLQAAPERERDSDWIGRFEGWKCALRDSRKVAADLVGQTRALDPIGLAPLASESVEMDASQEKPRAVLDYSNSHETRQEQ